MREIITLSRYDQMYHEPSVPLLKVGDLVEIEPAPDVYYDAKVLRVYPESNYPYLFLMTRDGTPYFPVFEQIRYDIASVNGESLKDDYPMMAISKSLFPDEIGTLDFRIGDSFKLVNDPIRYTVKYLDWIRSVIGLSYKIFDTNEVVYLVIGIDLTVQMIDPNSYECAVLNALGEMVG